MHSAETRLSTGPRSRRPGIILAACWLIVQVALFMQYGIFAELESLKYIGQAEYLIKHGTVTTSNFWLYSTQIFLIAASKLVGTGLASVVIVQLIFNGLATRALYRLATELSNQTTGLVVGLIFVFTIPMQVYNFFLQTESLFFSFTILFSCYILRLRKLTAISIISVLAFLALISVTRPSGLLWIPCAFLYLFFRFFKGIKVLLKAGISVAVAILFFIVLNAALGSGGELDTMLPFLDEQLICGVPTLSSQADIQTADNANSIQGLLYYITHNFGQFIRLAWLKTKLFFGLNRDYYSTSHNAFLICYFFPFYFLALFSIRTWMKKNKNVLLYCLSLVAITWGTVILSCDDWHNRFFFTIVPYIYVVSIPAINFIVGRIKKTITSNGNGE